MSNPGNTGHRGYHMSKVTAIAPRGDVVIVSLACGFEDVWTPYHGYTAEAWAEHIQQGHQPVVIGKTRLRCTEQHGPQVELVREVQK